MDKQRILNSIIEVLEANLQELELAVRNAQERATHAETKAENKYDTFGLEASYLAHGQAKRLQDVERELLAYRTMQLRVFTEDTGVGLGALVLLEDVDANERWVWLGEYAGGMQVMIDNQEVTVVTQHSPLGNAVMGKMVDDEVILKIGDSITEYTIIDFF